MRLQARSEEGSQFCLKVQLGKAQDRSSLTGLLARFSTSQAIGCVAKKSLPYESTWYLAFIKARKKREGAGKMEVSLLCNLMMEEMSHYFCCILFVDL